MSPHEPDAVPLLTLFQDLTAEEQALVWRMRTHPDVARWMANTGPIAWEDHLAFMARQGRDSSSLNWLATDGAGALGVVSLHGLDAADGSGELGIYRNPFRRDRGLGFRLLEALHTMAFGPLGLKRIWLKVDRGNAPALRLYEASGYARRSRPEADERFIYMDLADRRQAP